MVIAEWNFFTYTKLTVLKFFRNSKCSIRNMQYELKGFCNSKIWLLWLLSTFLVFTTQWNWVSDFFTLIFRYFEDIFQNSEYFSKKLLFFVSGTNDYFAIGTTAPLGKLLASGDNWSHLQLNQIAWLELSMSLYLFRNSIFLNISVLGTYTFSALPVSFYLTLEVNEKILGRKNQCFYRTDSLAPYISYIYQYNVLIIQ